MRFRTYHDFVQDGSGCIGHLIKLVDTADSTIGENQSTTDWSIIVSRYDSNVFWDLPFQDKLLRIWISGNVGCETDGRGSLSRSIHTTRCDLVYVLFESAMRQTSVSTQEISDIPAGSATLKYQDLRP
jgi:hypothetical protein